MGFELFSYYSVFIEVRQESSLMMDHVMKLREKFMEVDAEMKDKTIKKGKKDKKG